MICEKEIKNDKKTVLNCHKCKCAPDTCELAHTCIDRHCLDCILGDYVSDCPNYQDSKILGTRYRSQE